MNAALHVHMECACVGAYANKSQPDHILTCIDAIRAERERLGVSSSGDALVARG